MRRTLSFRWIMSTHGHNGSALRKLVKAGGSDNLKPFRRNHIAPPFSNSACNPNDKQDGHKNEYGRGCQRQGSEGTNYTHAQQGSRGYAYDNPNTVPLFPFYIGKGAPICNSVPTPLFGLSTVHLVSRRLPSACEAFHFRGHCDTEAT